MSYLTLKLIKKRAALTKSSHPWIFDGALDVKTAKDATAGIANLYTHDGQFVAVGSYNPKSPLAFRVFSKKQQEINFDFFERRFMQAKALRDVCIPPNTNGYRMINSEGDRLPGLTVEYLDGHLVVQVGTPAMSELAPVWLDALKKVYSPKSVIRKDSQSVANREKMTSVTEQLLGEAEDDISIVENGVQFTVDISGGQKTGFYFDQRDSRALVATLSKGKRVLDAYAYTGGFGAYALFAGASGVTALESSKPACELIEKNYALNASEEQTVAVVQGDANKVMAKTDASYDVVVLDPPALAKRRQHLDKASKVYRDIFASGVKCVAGEGGYLMACSCSAAVDIALLSKLVSQAVSMQGRQAQVLFKGGAGADHPVAAAHPEGEYLKVVLVRIY